MRKVIRQLVVEITFDGTEEEFISFADDLSHAYFAEELDSLDAGDATGLYSNLALREPDWTWTAMAPSGRMVAARVKNEAKFEWEGEWGS